MFGKIHGLVKDSALYGVGTIAARAVAFLLLPYYSHLMTPTEYGVYALFLVFVSIVQALYVHGIDIAFLRFSATAKGEQKRRDLGMALAQTLLVGGSISALIILFAPAIAPVIINGAGAREILITRICAGLMLSDTLSYHIFTFLRIQRRPVLFSTLKLIHVVLNISLNVLMVGTFRLGPLGAYLAFLAASVALLLLLLVLVHREIRFHWSWEQVRPWLIFGLPNLPSMIFLYAVEVSDRKWIEALLGIDQAGIYAAGYRVGMLMNMVAQAFRYAWQPFFLQTADDKEAKQIYARVLTYYVAVAGWIWLAATFLLGPLLKWNLPGIGPLIDERYWAGLQVFPIVMLAHIFNGVYANFMVGVYLEKKTMAIPAVIGLAAVVNVVGNGLLIPHFGYMASAWLTVASYALMAVVMYLYIQPRYPVPYEWMRILRIAMTLFVAWGLAGAARDHLPAIGALGVMILLLLVVPAVWWPYVLHKEERAALRRRFG